MNNTAGNITDVSKKFDHYLGSSKEYITSEFLSLFLVTVLISVVTSYMLVKRAEIIFLSEACVTLLIGAAIGGIMTLFQFLTRDRNEEEILHDLVTFDSVVFFTALLPPIIFAAGYHIKSDFFFFNLRSIMALAFAGTIISTLVFASLIYGIGQTSLSPTLTFPESLVFGSLISATDPVSTLAVFDDLCVDPHLNNIVFGESVLNDAVAIVLFRTFEKFVGHSFSGKLLGLALLDFALIFSGSLLVGAVCGVASSVFFKFVDLSKTKSAIFISFLIWGYVPFVVAEVCNVSGIVAVLFGGITMRHYTSNNIVKHDKQFLAELIHVLEKLAETLVFLDLGSSIWSPSSLYNPRFIAWCTFFILIARAVNVYPIGLALRPCSKNKISLNTLHMIWFSGLRGAIAYALAEEFPDTHGNKDLVKTTTIVIVLITVIVGGGLTAPMIKLLKIRRLTADELRMMVPPVGDGMHPCVKLDMRYITPWLCKKLVLPNEHTPQDTYDDSDWLAGNVTSVEHESDFTDISAVENDAVANSDKVENDGGVERAEGDAVEGKANDDGLEMTEVTSS